MDENLRLLSRYASKMRVKQILLSNMKCVPKPAARTTLILMNRQDTAITCRKGDITDGEKKSPVKDFQFLWED